MLSFNSAATSATHQVAATFHTRRAPLQAALPVLHRQVIPELAAEGVLVSLHALPPGGAVPDLQLVSEAVLLARLCREAQDWTVSVLQIARIRELSRFDAVGQQAVDEAQLIRPAATVVLDDEAEAVFNALRAAHHHLAPRPKRKQKDLSKGPVKRGKKQQQKQQEAVQLEKTTSLGHGELSALDLEFGEALGQVKSLHLAAETCRLQQLGAKRTWGAASRQTLKHPRIALQLLQVLEVVHVAVSQVPLA